MTTHIFIVNSNTFGTHLKYLFVGTTSREKDENISLLSDIKRVRAGDLGIFYIEGTTKSSGGFYGLFKIADQIPLVFHAKGEDSLKPNLPIKLIYRTIIEPLEVYSNGVPEWEALDKLPVYAADVQWSLIYRKLKGGRGCTPILPNESDKLIELIRNKNEGKLLADSTYLGGFDWKNESRQIIKTDKKNLYPLERQSCTEIETIIIKKYLSKSTFEGLLQLFFTERAGIEKRLDEVLGDNIYWLGNEVPCGVGMQKIDIMTIYGNKEKPIYRIVELKTKPIDPSIIFQIETYVNWASQDFGKHLQKAYNWNIQPVIVAFPCSPANFPLISSAFREFNRKNKCLPIEYFEIKTDPLCKSIIFEKKNY